MEEKEAIENILADRENYKALYERALNDLVQAEAKANKYDSLVENIKDKIESVINEGKSDSEKYMEDVMFRQGYYKALEELLDTEKQ